MSTIIYKFDKNRYTNYNREERVSNELEVCIIQYLFKDNRKGNLIISESFRTTIFAIDENKKSSDIYIFEDYNSYIKLISNSIQFRFCGSYE